MGSTILCVASIMTAGCYTSMDKSTFRTYCDRLRRHCLSQMIKLKNLMLTRGLYSLFMWNLNSDYDRLGITRVTTISPGSGLPGKVAWIAFVHLSRALIPSSRLSILIQWFQNGLNRSYVCLCLQAKRGKNRCTVLQYSTQTPT